MNYTKAKPVGIDKPIQLLQTFLYSKVSTLFNLDDNNYNQYGRIYRNTDGTNGYQPQAFVGGLEYDPLFLNDKIVMHSFFDIGETITANTDLAYKYKANVSLYVFCNVAKLETLVTGYAPVSRYDEEVRVAFMNLLDGKYEFRIQTIDVGAKKALSDYTGKDKTVDVSKAQQPYHIFRINMVLPNYDTKFNNC